MEEKEELSMLIHHQYFYKTATLDTIKKGLHEAIHEKKYDANGVYQHVINGAYYYERIDVLEYVFDQKDFKLRDEQLTETLGYIFTARFFKSGEFFIKKDVKLNLNNDSVLWVLPFCSLDLLKTIREKGHDIYDPQYNLLFLSFREYPPKYEIIEDMISLGADLNDTKFKNNLYYHLFTFDADEHIEKIKYLVSKGFDINVDDSQLMKLAVNHKAINIATYLMEAGINLYPKKESLFYYCARHQDLDIAEFLWEKGITFDPKNSSLIEEVSKFENLMLAKWLINKGFDLDVARQFSTGEIKEWCIEKMKNNLTDELPITNDDKKKNKL